MSSPSFVAQCRHVLELSGVRPGDSVVVLSQGDERRDYVEAFLTALTALEADSVHLRMGEPKPGLDAESGTWTVGQTPLQDRPDVVDAIGGSRLLVDLIFLLHSRELNQIRETGTRVLTCIEPKDILARLMPDLELAKESDAAGASLEGAKELRVYSDAGTDVTFAVDSYPTFVQSGFPRNDGDWDHWASSGMVYTYGRDDGVDGTVVFAAGDIILPFKRYVAEPITLEISSGRIETIRGGWEAELVKDYMEGFDDPDAYGLAHIGWGLNPNARWSALAADTRGHGMEVRGFRGNVLFSTGPNVQAGGANATPCHLDIPMRGCSLELDGTLVLDQGRVL